MGGGGNASAGPITGDGGVGRVEEGPGGGVDVVGTGNGLTCGEPLGGVGVVDSSFVVIGPSAAFLSGENNNSPDNVDVTKVIPELIFVASSLTL